MRRRRRRGDAAHRLGGRAVGITARAAQRGCAGSARTGRWPAGASRRSRSRRARARAAAIRQLRISATVSPTIVTSRRVGRERVERDVDRALERVLDRHERGVDGAVLHRHHGVVERRQRDRLGARGAVRVEQRLVAEGALGPEIADAHARRAPRRRARGAAPLPPRARAAAPAAPRDDLLGVQPRLVAVVDRGEHDARAVGVEQRDRQRLVARHLVVGVVADERAVGRRRRRAAARRRPGARRGAGRRPRRSRAALRNAASSAAACATRSRSPCSPSTRRCARAHAPQRDARATSARQQRDHRDRGGGDRDQLGRRDLRREAPPAG